MTVLTEQHRLLWFGPSFIPANVSAAVNGRWEVVPCPTTQAVRRQLNGAALAIIAPAPGQPFDPRWLARLLDEVDRSQAVAIVLLPAHLPESSLLSRRRAQYSLMDAEASPAELAACLDAAAALQPTIRNLQTDVAAVRSFGRGMPHDLEDVDEEMRLAARLQRDFLPRTLPQIAPVRFAALFRPAGWVSGDIYDVFRLDEANVGFYVADVVGHGMPAALLSMFVKKALQTKRILGNTYEIVPPEKALAQLNNDICSQELTSCQFCTAVYGILNTRCLRLQYARGGHPAPLMLAGDGTVETLDAIGPLLGVFPGETFQPRERTLRPGDRLVIYSDGLEETLCPHGPHEGPGIAEQLQTLRRLPPEEMILHLAARIDHGRADSPRGDDVTVLLTDIADE